jgi:hypothetical protein
MGDSGGRSEDQNADKNAVKSSCHKRNANQDYTKISFYPS